VTAALVIGSSALSLEPSGLCELPRVDRRHATSQACLACHDGTVAGEVHFSTERMSRGSHPVDVSYSRAGLEHPDTFHPQGALPGSLVLNDGRVTCATCHDGASREPHKVAVTMSASALCFSCHNL
jgi:predicted CXXCH cytochrome family protein